MVKSIEGFVTDYGSMHSTYEEAIKAEQEEKQIAFNKELREALGYTERAWSERHGELFSNMVVSYAPIFRRLMDKYGLESKENDGGH